MVEPEPIVPGAPGRELDEPVGRLVSEFMLEPALPVPLDPLVPLVPLDPLVSELPDPMLPEEEVPDEYPELSPELPELPEDMPDDPELPDDVSDGLVLLPLLLAPEPMVPELPEEELLSDEVPEVELPLLMSLPAEGRELVLSVVLPLWAKAMPAVPIMAARTASRSFFMVSPCKKWLSLQQALKVSR